MSEIKIDLEIYASSCEKIKALRKEIKEIEHVKRKHEDKIKAFLKAQECESITYKDYRVELRSINKSARMRLSEESARALDILHKHGVRDADEALKQLRERSKIQVEELRLK